MDEHQTPRGNKALILDSMEVLQQMQNIPKQFGLGLLAFCIFNNIINIILSFNSKAVLLVTDTYFKVIKYI